VKAYRRSFTLVQSRMVDQIFLLIFVPVFLLRESWYSSFSHLQVTLSREERISFPP